MPKPIASYIEAENRADADAVAQCFARNATVRDEGRTMRGNAAIRQWTLEASKKYRHTMEPLRLSREQGKTIVTNRVIGNFPGSPIELRFIFTLRGDKITSLQVRP